MKQTNIKCPYCGAKANLKPSTAVYQKRAKSNDYLYVCQNFPRCDAYVAAHKHNLQPMGTLADGQLRHKRILAHKAFDRLWQSGQMRKGQAYQWLQAKFSLRYKYAHIAMFSDYMCEQVITEVEKALTNMKISA